MHSLPAELHALIFDYACLDDGTTARELALVSRYVRDVAAPFRYQSLSVAGLDALTQLDQRLARLPPHRRRVRRLFLSDWTRAQACAEAAPAADDAALARYDAEHAAAARLLARVAPTLDTLALHAACPYTSTALLAHLLALPLPRLAALALHGFYPFPPPAAHMPRLARLRLAGNRNPHGLLASRALARACPRLRELTVAGLVAAPAFADEVRLALAADPAPLAALVLETGPPPARTRRGGGGGALAQHEKMLTVLRSLPARDGDVRVQVVEGGNSAAHPYDVLRSGLW